jgi:hypothetical protein
VRLPSPLGILRILKRLIFSKESLCTFKGDAVWSAWGDLDLEVLRGLSSIKRKKPWKRVFSTPSWPLSRDRSLVAD